MLEFRKAISAIVRYRTFQKANDVADGLAYVWEEKHKWNKISAAIGQTNRTAKEKLNSIAYRRDRIVHNADFNEATGGLDNCNLVDAMNAISHIQALVGAIDGLVP